MPPRLPQNAPSIVTRTPSIFTHCSQCLKREFSSSPAVETRHRRQMFAWLQGPGENFRHPLPSSTNYLSAYDKRGTLLRKIDTGSKPGAETEDAAALEAAAEGSLLQPETRDDLRPFPLNQHFVSESVLSEPLRQEIWRRVQVDKKSVRTVSVELGVEMRRVGAVVRLVELERRMKVENKPLALPYARAIHAMVPTTPYDPSTKTIVPHESINDLPVHSLTTTQLFYPTSESRAFNRVDAGRVFSAAPRLPDDEDVGQGGKPAVEPWQDVRQEFVGKRDSEMQVLKPADARIPHPHLIAFAQDKRDPQLRGNEEEIRKRYAQRLTNDASERAKLRDARIEREEKKKTRIDTSRWQFVVKEVKATREGIGKDGRGTNAPGFRYGVPHEDRKKAQIKIPTKVEV